MDSDVAPDRPGGFSIVVQGPLDRANATAIATNLAAWRAAYPHAQLLCVISTTDCFGQGPAGELQPLDSGDGTALVAAEVIIQACDAIAFAPTAKVLTPIKTDSPGPNHVNLQIAAARTGLALASGHHVLRIRNDLTFQSRRLFDAYEAAQGVPRGSRAMLAERILASQLFTLNPLTVQRMPFHVSDWFHLGLTSDVRWLWGAVVPATAASAAWYHDHPHMDASNANERLFLTRLAPEQMITFPAFASTFPDLSLAYHNDPTSVAASLTVVADNFGIADMADCGASLPKYQHVIDGLSAFTRLECLSQDQLERVAASPGRSVRDILAPEIAAIARHNGRWARVRRSARRWSRRIVRRFANG